MKRRVLLVVVLGLCSLGTTAAVTPTMGTLTQVWVDCAWSWWSFEVEARTTVDGVNGPVYEVGVATSWAAGCHWWSCEDEGYDEDVKDGDAPASVFHGNNGYGWEHSSFSGSASSYHWVEAENFSDSGNTGDSGYAAPCSETR